MPKLVLSRFDGGLNLRDSPTILAPNETPSALNWTLDERGAVRVSDGSTSQVSLPGVTTKRAFVFYSEALDTWLCARETTGAPNSLRLYTRPGDLSGSWTNRGSLAIDPSNALAAFIDWPGSTPKVIVTASTGSAPGSGGGGIYSWDGTTFSNISTTIGGSALALWQNRVWMTGYGFSNSTGNPSRLFASKIGDPTVWATPDGLTVDVRDKDGQSLRALGVAAGALIAFKTRSAYRINDSSTGSYTTIDSASGAMGPLAVVAQQGRLYSWGADGLYEWDGIGRGRNVGDKARPAFANDSALVGGVPSLSGGPLLETRVLFAYPSSPGGSNNLLLEYDVRHGWIMRHSLATNAIRPDSFARKNNVLYGASGGTDTLWSMFDNSSSPGGTNANNFHTPWLSPAGGRLCRLNRLDIQGLLSYAVTGDDTLAISVYKDGDVSSATTYQIASSLLASGVLDETQTAILQGLGHARSFRFSFSYTQGTHISPGAAIHSMVLDYSVLEP